jgi:hypothetical protein
MAPSDAAPPGFFSHKKKRSWLKISVDAKEGNGYVLSIDDGWSKPNFQPDEKISGSENKV